MPTYTIKNKKTEEEHDVFCSWDHLQELLQQDPNLTQKITHPGIVSTTGASFNKAGDGWRDVLKKVKSGSAKSNTIKD